MLLVGLISAIGPVGPVWASESAVVPGRLAPKVVVDGKAREDCRLTATRIDKGLKGMAPISGTAPLALPPGWYRVRVDCGPTWIGAIAKVELRSDKAAEPKLSLQRSRIRMMVERNGQRIPAELRIYRSGAETDEEPLYVASANSSAELAAGVYDLIVAAKAEDGATIEAELRKARLNKGKLAAFSADLSNGSLRVSATDNGKKAEGLVKIFRRGALKRPVVRGDTSRLFELSPGRYVVETTLGSTANFATQRSEVWVRSKKKSSIRERFETGRLKVDVRQNGKPVPAVVRLGLPGAGDFFNYFEAPGDVVLSPGEYRVTVEAKINAPIKTKEQLIEIRKKGSARASFDFTPSKLVVEVVRAGRKVEVESIEVLRAGGGGNIGQPNFDGEYVIWPGRYEVVARLANGDRAHDGPFEVDWGQNLVRKVEVSHGTLTVSAQRKKTVVKTVKILVFRPGAKSPVAELEGEGTVALAPGIYDLRIVDGPTTSWHEGVKVHERKNTQLAIELGASAQDKSADLPEGEQPEGELPEGE